MSFQDSEAKCKGEREKELSRANEAVSTWRYMMGNRCSFDLTKPKTVRILYLGREVACITPMTSRDIHNNLIHIFVFFKELRPPPMGRMVTSS